MPLDPKEVTLLDSLASLRQKAQLVNLGTRSGTFEKQHSQSIVKELDTLMEYVQKANCNFIVFDNDHHTKLQHKID